MDCGTLAVGSNGLGRIRRPELRRVEPGIASRSRRHRWRSARDGPLGPQPARTLGNSFRHPHWLRLTDQLETAQPTVPWSKVLNGHPHLASPSLAALYHYRVFLNAGATDETPARSAHPRPPRA